MSTPVDRQARIITDWTAVLVDALTAGDTTRAATASATITVAAEAILGMLDPHRRGRPVPAGQRLREAVAEGARSAGPAG